MKAFQLEFVDADDRLRPIIDLVHCRAFTLTKIFRVLFQNGRSTHVVAGRAPVKVDGTSVKRIPLAVPVRVHRYVTQHLS